MGMTSPDELPAAENIDAHVPDALELAAGFDPATRAQWEDAVLKVLNRGRPEGKELSIDQALSRLRTTTVEGLTLEPIYTREDDTTELGHPGAAPFTRGATLRTGEIDAWDVRAIHENPDSAETRLAILTDLERGATSIHLRVDPDAVAPDDVANDLADVLLDMAKISVNSRHDQRAAADAVLAVFGGSDVPNDKLSVNLGLDPIGFAALNHTDADLSGLAGWVEAIRPFDDHSRAFTVDGTIWHDAGAGDVHEPAWLIATAVEYVRALIDQGVSATEAFQAINFRVSATAEQFTTIARLRALRTLWNRVGEVFEVPAEHRGARQWAVQSWRQITRDDAYNNILRSTISTFAAAVGGAEAISTLPFDTAWGLPTDFSRRIARNTQIVLAEESHIGRVNDPAGGSFYVDQLTRTLEDAAWAEFQRVEAAGGMIAALNSGHVSAELARLNEERAKRLHHRTLPITGVSMFPNPTEEPLTGQTPRPPAPERHGLPWHRDSEIFERLRDATAAADGEPAVFLACLGTRRDFGAREGFTKTLFHIAGLATPSSEGGDAAAIAEQFKASGSPVAVLCSNAATYAEQGRDVADALRAAGAQRVLLAGAFGEVGEGAEASFDGRVYAGMNVVELLTDTLGVLGIDTAAIQIEGVQQ